MPEDIITSTSTPTPTSSSPPAKKGTKKGTVKPPSASNGKRSLNLSLPPEDYQRLALHALDQDKTISDLVSELARTHLRSVHLTRTASRTE